MIPPFGVSRLYYMRPSHSTFRVFGSDVVGNIDIGAVARAVSAQAKGESIHPPSFHVLTCKKKADQETFPVCL